MSEPFRPYEKLVDITIFGKKFQVPERNSFLNMSSRLAYRNRARR